MEVHLFLVTPTTFLPYLNHIRFLHRYLLINRLALYIHDVHSKTFLNNPYL